MNIDQFIPKPKRKGTGAYMIRLDLKLSNWISLEAEIRNISVNALIVAIIKAYQKEQEKALKRIEEMKHE